MYQIFVGLVTEGSTDNLFLETIVRKTFTHIALDECSTDIEIFVTLINQKKKNLNFIEHVLESSKEGYEAYGISFLCVHADADSNTNNIAYNNKIKPLLDRIKEQDDTQYCKTIIPIIPIQETESWMLADKELLKKFIGTDKNDNDLKINKNPEQIKNPKEVIEEAIRIARSDLTKRRRRKLSIAELYLPIGQSIEIDKLKKLNSYIDFQKNVRKAYKEVNLLY